MRLIDADALLEDLKKTGRYFQAKFDIENAPTVPLPDFKEGYKQAIRDGKTNFTKLKGEWVEKLDYNRDTYYDCSVCGNSWTTIEGTPWDNGMNFCPNCGADMRGDKK